MEVVKINLSLDINFPWTFISGRQRIIDFVESNEILDLVWFLCDSSCEGELAIKYPDITDHMINVDQFGATEENKYAFAVWQIAGGAINIDTTPAHRSRKEMAG